MIATYAIGTILVSLYIHFMHERNVMLNLYITQRPYLTTVLVILWPLLVFAVLCTFIYYAIKLLFVQY